MTEVVLHFKLEGHTSDINCCAWSPVTRSTLTSCSADGTLRVWDISTNPPKVLSIVPVSSKFYVNACSYNPSGDLLATASSGAEETVKIWSTASWSVIGSFSPHEDSVRWCTFSPDGNLLATASDDTRVCVFEVGALRQLSTLTRNSERVNCCMFAPAGWLLVTGSSSGDLLLFNVYNGQLLKSQLSIHDMGVTALALDPLSIRGGGAYEQFKMASTGNDAIIRLWTIRYSGTKPSSKSVSFVLDALLEGHSAAVYSCSYHPTQPLLASGSADKSVLLWSLVSRLRIHKLEGHTRYVIHVNFSPDGSHLVSTSNDKTILLWKMGGNEQCEGQLDNSTARDSSNTEKLPSLISSVSWLLSDVIDWVDNLAGQQGTGQPLHTDDQRAVERLALAVQQVSTAHDYDQVEEDLKCPITCELMRDPVLAADGYTYERTAITGWFSKGRRTSPVTNLPLTNTLLLPNRALKKIIERHRASN